MSVPTTEQAVCPITLTEKAANEVKRIIAQQAAPGGTPEKLYLRMHIQGGGCAGFQPKLELDREMDPKRDELFEVHGVTVAVDRKSLLYLNGVVVDYLDDRFPPGFHINNPNAKSTCGCGSSFSM